MDNFIVATFISIAILPGLAACSDSNPTPPPVPETAVYLEGAIGASTRGVIGSGYEQDLEVSFARQDESAVSTGTYPSGTGFGSGNAPSGGYIRGKIYQEPPGAGYCRSANPAGRGRRIAPRGTRLSPSSGIPG